MKVAETNHAATPDQAGLTVGPNGVVAGALPSDYPLLGRCAVCAQPIRCVAGDADWYHPARQEWDGLAYDVAIDWLRAVRRYGVAKANTLFPEGTPVPGAAE